MFENLGGWHKRNVSYQLILETIFNFQLVSDASKELRVVVSTGSVLHRFFAGIGGQRGCNIVSKHSVAVLYQILVSCNGTVTERFVSHSLVEDILLVKIHL